MFDTITGATMSAKRLSQAHDLPRSKSREVVARAAGYRDWHHLTRVVGTPNAPVCDVASIRRGVWPHPMTEYLRTDPALGGIDPWELAEIIVPEPVMPREIADPLLAVACDELARHEGPAWLSVDSIVVDHEGGRSLIVTARGRDGIRAVGQRLSIEEEVTMVVTPEGLRRVPSGRSDEDLVRTAVAGYADAYHSDDLPTPVSVEEVAEGRHDHLYGVDVPTLRRAIARHGTPEAARDALRRVVSIPIYTTMLNTDVAEEDEDAGIRHTKHAGVAAQATAYPKDGVLRWTIRFDGVTWDRTLHVDDRTRASSLRVGDPVGGLCAHPWMDGARITAIHDDGVVVRVETDHRCIRLDTAHLPEDGWVDHVPLRREVAGRDGIEPVDAAVANRLGVPIDDMLTSCWDGYHHFSVVREPDHGPVVVMSKIHVDQDYVDVTKTYEGAGSFYASELPLDFLDHCGPVQDEGDSFWRARIRGLSDREAYGDVML
jgi:hypothetical protein